MNILKIAVPTPILTPLDYLAPNHWALDQLNPGTRILVPFRNQKLVGILLGQAYQTSLPHNKLKSALEIIDDIPSLDKSILDLAQWATSYYHYPIGEVLASCLPKKLRQGKNVVIEKYSDTKIINKQKPLILNLHQSNAISVIASAIHQFHVFLLHGVTGSGKTEVYLQLIEKIIAKNLQALVLVPEIGLTPQTVARFSQRFNVPLAILHSKLTDNERAQAWFAAKENHAKIIIGTRSAIFTPMPHLGLIILDEEHDPSYKQQDGFRYHARDIAIIRAQQNNIPIILGSATPSLESQYNVMQQKFSLIELPERAGDAKLPQIKIIDIRNQALNQGLSKPLLSTINDHLNQDGQILLFLNRRGYAPVLICHACGYIAKCKTCDSQYVYHKKANHLQCHHCGRVVKVLEQCPQCQCQQMIPLGLGTERIESALTQHFPAVGIARIDRDNTRKKNALNVMINNIHQGHTQIFIGTQMLAKGHHFPKVSLVAIIDIDYGFFSTDLRAQERIGQLIMQVAGRAGREHKVGEVLLQTHHPDHPLLQHLLAHDYKKFSEALLTDRQQTLLPPYSFHTLIRAEACDKNLISKFLEKISQFISKHSPSLQCYGPFDAPIARVANRARMQLLIQTKARKQMHVALDALLSYINTLKEISKIRWSIDVDPQDFY